MATNKQEWKYLTATLIKIGENVKMIYKSDLKQGNKYASGKLYNSIDYRVEVRAQGVKLYFVASDYYINIENGRKAGSKMPPILAIMRWMKMKGIKQTGKQTIKRAAYVISRSIGEKGIKAKPYLKNIKKGLLDYVDDINFAINQDLGIEVDNITAKLKEIKGSKHITIKKI